MEFVAFVAELVSRGIPFRHGRMADGSRSFFVSFSRADLWDS